MNAEEAKAATAEALRAQIYEMEASGGLTPLGAADLRRQYGLAQPWEVTPRGTEALPDGMTAEKLREISAAYRRLQDEAIGSGVYGVSQNAAALDAWADALAAGAGVRQHRDTPTREEVAEEICARDVHTSPEFSPHALPDAYRIADALIARGWLAVSDGVDPQEGAQ